MIGSTVSHYRILGKLGRGGMGVVYIAEDTHLGRRVAVKFSTSAIDNAPFRARFLREARAASMLNHPHIASIYDYGETPEGEPFIVMELVQGEDLFHLLQRGPLPVAQSLRIARAVAEALGEAHRNGIIHRDIKPGNIVVGENGLVKVLDFGLAKQMEKAAPSEGDPTVLHLATQEGVVLGTPSYMSPEQACDQALGPPSDLFSLGVVLYECLAGKAPFAGASSVEILGAVLHVEPAEPSHWNPAVTPQVDRIVQRALAKSVGARYRSADEMSADLQAAMGGLDPNAETILLPSRVPGQASGRAANGTGGAWTGAFTGMRKTLTGAWRRPRARTITLLAAAMLAVIAAWWIWNGNGYKPAADAQRWYDEGVAGIRDGTYYKASKALERAASLDARFAMAHARLAEALLELDYADRAKEEMLRASPPGSTPRVTRPEQLYIEALHLTLTGDFPGAIGKYREMAERTPLSDRANSYVDLGRAYEKSEKPKDALSAYRQATQWQPQNPAAWLRLAVLYGRQRDLPKAAAAFQEAESLYRSHSNLEGVTEVLYQRATLANQTGQGGQARALIGQALDMTRQTGNVSQQIVALQQLSNIELRGGANGEAERLANQAIELARANGLESLTTRGLIDLGNAYFIRGEFAEASQRFTQALDYARRFHAQRSEARALLSMGSLELQHGQPMEGLRDVAAARAWYERGGYRQETAQALILMAREQRQNGDLPAAFESFAHAQKLGDGAQLGASEQGMGSVLESQERWPEALTHFQAAAKAAAESGDRVGAPYYAVDIGRMLCRLGRADEARAELAKIDAGANAAVLVQADYVRAAIAITQRQFAAAMENSRRVLAHEGLSPAFVAGARSMLGTAAAATGARAAALEVTGEAVKLAGKYGSTVLMVDPVLARVEALLAAGDRRRALETALDAEGEFARANREEPAWRGWVLAARAAEDAAAARGYAGKAAASLAALEKKWDSGSYQSYLSRPDLQLERGLLSRLSGTK